MEMRPFPQPGIKVCKPQTPCEAAGFHDDQMAYLLPMIEQLLERGMPEGLSGVVLHADGGAAVESHASVAYRLRLHDELSAFRGAAARGKCWRKRRTFATGRYRFYRADPSLYAQKQLPSQCPLLSE